MAHPHGGSRSDAEWHHISKRDGVQSDLVAGEWNGTKPGDERGDQCKDAAFQCELNRGRQSEGNEAADTREVDVDGSSQKFSAVFSVVPQ